MMYSTITQLWKKEKQLYSFGNSFVVYSLVIESDPCCFQVSIACEPDKPEDEDCKGSVVSYYIHIKMIIVQTMSRFVASSCFEVISDYKLISLGSYKYCSLEDGRGKKFSKFCVTSDHYQIWHTGSGQFQPFTWPVSAPDLGLMLVTIIFRKWLKKMTDGEGKILFTVVLAIKKYFQQQNSTVDTFYNSFAIWIHFGLPDTE